MADPELKPTLDEVQRRLSVAEGHRITYRDLASIGQVSLRAVTEWMRGASAPRACTALLRLLSRLPPDQVDEVLKPWRSERAALPQRSTTPRRKAPRPS